MQSQYYKTEQLLFKYFRYIKANKYFSAPMRTINRNPEITQADIANALHNSNLTEIEFAVVCEFGLKQHAPKIRNSQLFTLWLNAIGLLHDEFKNRGWVKC